MITQYFIDSAFLLDIINIEITVHNIFDLLNQLFIIIDHIIDLIHLLVHINITNPAIDPHHFYFLQISYDFAHSFQYFHIIDLQIVTIIFQK